MFFHTCTKHIAGWYSAANLPNIRSRSCNDQRKRYLLSFQHWLWYFGLVIKDLKNWRKEAPVFSKAPQWAVDTIPNFKGHIWAPDISYHNSQYYLYYSVSAFGENTSAIGVSTNKTLDSSSADFKWIDHGRVLQSYPGTTNWNAIDPNLIIAMALL